MRALTIFYAASWIAAGSPDINWVRACGLELDFAGSNPGSLDLSFLIYKRGKMNFLEGGFEE